MAKVIAPATSHPGTLFSLQLGKAYQTVSSWSRSGKSQSRRSWGRLRPSTQVLREMTLKCWGKGLQAGLTYDTKSDLCRNDPPLLP
jgi:hypothetical protein